MDQKTVAVVSGVLFGLMALLHLLRLILGWEANIAGWNVPVWLSVVFLVVAAWLSWENLKVLKSTA